MIKKPDILSDDKIENVLSPILSVDINNGHRVVAQAQNDYCYKEMLGQFIRLLYHHTNYKSTGKKSEGGKAVLALDKELEAWFFGEWEALQSSLEEGL